MEFNSYNSFLSASASALPSTTVPSVAPVRAAATKGLKVAIPKLHREMRVVVPTEATPVDEPDTPTIVVGDPPPSPCLLPAFFLPPDYVIPGKLQKVAK